MDSYSSSIFDDASSTYSRPSTLPSNKPHSTTTTAPVYLQDGLIKVMQEVQQTCAEIGITTDLKLPTIVVIGEQTIGKSSTLELTTGYDILPRGTGIVTRVPILVKLQNITEVSEEKIVVTAGIESEQFGITEAEKARSRIEKFTESLVPDKGIADKPITVSIYARNTVSLSFVDLPGITKNPMPGQPTDIAKQTKNMVRRYIRDRNTIILAVAAAVTDIANSEAIKLDRAFIEDVLHLMKLSTLHQVAREHDIDPEGNRTLVVVTKLDLMDKGTDAVDILTGKTYPVKLGIVGVKCRSQQDNKDNKPIGEVRRDEEKFFYENYRSISQKHGSRYLSRRLNALLLRKIEDNLPEIQTAISKKIEHCRAMVVELGEPITDNVTRNAVSIIINFKEYLDNAMHGRSSNIDSNEIVGGAKIYQKFYENLPDMLRLLTPGETATMENIDHVRRNAMGGTPHAFMPHRAYEAFMTKDIEKLRNPCITITDQITVDIVQIVHDIINGTMNISEKYPMFAGLVEEITNDVIRKQVQETKNRIVNLIEAEKNFINLNHPDMDQFYRDQDDDNHVRSMKKHILPTFCKTGQGSSERSVADEEIKGDNESLITDSGSTASQETGTMFSTEQQLPKTKMVENEVVRGRMQNDPLFIARMIRAYYEIVSKTINDQVIKCIWTAMVLDTIKKLQTELITQIIEDRADELSELFREQPAIVRNREENNRLLQVLERASGVITQLKEQQMNCE